VPIQSRSGEVIGLGNMRAVVPTFGLEPNRIGDSTSRYGLLAYNFFREYAEELFDLEDVVQSVIARRASLDWIFELPQVALLESEMVAGRVSLSTTGFCVIPQEGVLSIAMLAVAESPELFRKVRAQTNPNWEAVEGGHSSVPIEFVRLDDHRLDDWVDGLFAAEGGVVTRRGVVVQGV